MLRSVGLTSEALQQDLDTIYAEKLLSFVRSSSLDHIVILAQDYPYESAGRRLDDAGSFYVPNGHVLGLADRHPEFLAGVSIHPARPDALDELDLCLEGGAALLKCLPNCQNIDWSDRRYTRFLERMAETKLPLLAHTGGEHALPVLDKRLADPRVLIRPLEIGVVCIAAHCGTASAFLERSYFDEFVGLLHRFPNLYGDNSAFNLPNGRLRRNTLNRCLELALSGRILHGSDTPVPVLGHELFLRGRLSRHAFRTSLSEDNPIERDYQLKRAMGFPDETFTRAGGLLHHRVSARIMSSLTRSSVGRAPPERHVGEGDGRAVERVPA